MIPPNERFSRIKANLKSGEFEELTDFQKMKAIVLRNREAVMNSEIAKGEEGVFGFPNFEKFFSLDGSIVFKIDEGDLFSELLYGDFFRMSGRLATKGGAHYLRGERYLAAIDPNLETRQRLDILFEDFAAGVNSLFSGTRRISKNGHAFKQDLAVLDYIKNSTVTTLNALIQYEKKGIFRLDDIRYQAMRRHAFNIAQSSVNMYFSYLLGHGRGFVQELAIQKDNIVLFENVIRYLEQEHREGTLSSASFSRPEANHPLVIGAFALLNTEKKDIHPHIIFGFPSGSTELALAQQFTFKLIRSFTPLVVLMPFSIYSVLQLPKSATEGKDITSPLVFLEKHRRSIDGTEVMIVEDNSNTGNTIQRFYDLLMANFKPKKVTVAVAEADIIRAQQLKNSKTRTTVASGEVYESVINILPVGKKNLKTEMKEEIERLRLIKECKLNLAAAQDSTEKMMYSIFLRNLEEPTEGLIRGLNRENAILKVSGTRLSNVYVVPVNYFGVEYTSVEKAYQAEKFRKEDLANIPSEIMDEINEMLRIRGFYSDRTDLVDFFTSPNTSSINAKMTADILRKHGFQRPDWDYLKVKTMLELLQLKYSDPKAMASLKATGNKYIVEGNDWGDTFWGVDNGVGKNILGLALMYIRDNTN